MKTIKFFLKAIAVIASLFVSVIVMEIFLDFHDKVNTYEDPIWGFIAFCFMVPMITYVISSLSINFINRIG
jgi:hypothetical protein